MGSEHKRSIQKTQDVDWSFLSLWLKSTWTELNAEIWLCLLYGFMSESFWRFLDQVLRWNAFRADKQRPVSSFTVHHMINIRTPKPPHEHRSWTQRPPAFHRLKTGSRSHRYASLSLNSVSETIQLEAYKTFEACYMSSKFI